MSDLSFKTTEEFMHWLIDGNSAVTKYYTNLVYKMVDGNIVYYNKHITPRTYCMVDLNALDQLGAWSKYIEPKWYDNIKEPVLCWVSNVNSTPTVNIDLISGYSVAKFDSAIHTFVGKRKYWNNAVPMTDEEKLKYSPNRDI